MWEEGRCRREMREEGRCGREVREVWEGDENGNEKGLKGEVWEAQTRHWGRGSREGAHRKALSYTALGEGLTGRH